MTTEVDRRAQGASRIPFDALVEVGGATGPAFEAQAVNVSEEGMSLRTAYLPEIGQPITCRFDAGSGQSVLASGEVVWSQSGGKGGEFGIRFTDMDAESIDSLRRMCGVEKDAPDHVVGAKVRLHIEGLASPMRARVRDSKRSAVTVGSDLAFLQVGKELELEDATSGNKRPARIDRVEVEVDSASRVPQLVVSLRYGGEDSAADSPDEPRAEATARGVEDRHDASARDEALAAAKRVPEDVKGALTRGVSKLGPAFATFTKRAKTTIALLAAQKGAAQGEPPIRRTTAPAPGGGLHTSGRRVIRGETMSTTNEEATTQAPPKFKMTKRKLAIGGAAIVAIALAAVALKKPHTPPTATNDAAQAGSHSQVAPLRAPDPPVALTAPPPAIPVAAAPPPAPAGMMESAPPPADPTDKKHHKGAKVTPFGNGPVAHGNLLHVRMDGPIESIQGAQQPTGFTVKIPGRKAVDQAGALAARDSRIATVKAANDGNGVELVFTFKDGVPNYQVRAKGSTLEIALAQPGNNKGAVAKKDGGHKHAGAKKKKDDDN